MSAPSLERIVPDELSARGATGRDTLDLHLERYELAARHARGRVLDLACGTGYGTRLVGDRGTDLIEVVGVDIAADAIAYAEDRYSRPGVRFEPGDALAFEDPIGFDTVISLETIEHVEAPAQVFARLVSVLRPGGRLIASVPITPSVDVNPHHRHDFTERSWRALAAVHPLDEIEYLRQVQKVPIIGVLRRSEARMTDMRPNLASYYAAHPRAALRRIAATLRYGFTNHYATIVWQRRS